MFCVQRGICHKGWMGWGVGGWGAQMASVNMNNNGDACCAPYFTIISHDFRQNIHRIHINFRRSLEKNRTGKIALKQS